MIGDAYERVAECWYAAQYFSRERGCTVAEVLESDIFVDAAPFFLDLRGLNDDAELRRDRIKHLSSMVDVPVSVMCGFL